MSWSGRIALTYTLKFQKAVRTLILVASSSAKHTATNPPQDPSLSETEKLLLEIVWKTPYNVTEDLTRITVPTLILIGDRDPRLEAARLMHARIPNSTLITIEGLDHELVEKHAISAMNILNWLNKMPEGTI